MQSKNGSENPILISYVLCNDQSALAVPRTFNGCVFFVGMSSLFDRRPVTGIYDCKVY